jgi:hypothetical protein
MGRLPLLRQPWRGVPPRPAPHPPTEGPPRPAITRPDLTGERMERGSRANAGARA